MRCADRLATVILLIAAFVSRSRADQPFFMGLGHLPGGLFSSYATDMSADGKIVVGVSRADTAFRWTKETGMVGIGAGGGSTVRISDDGSTITGNSSGPFRWTQSSGYTLLPLGGLPAGTVLSYGISGDGSIIVGEAGNTSSTGVRWVNGGAPEQFLPHPTQDISADGTVVIGFGLPADSVMSDKYIWTAQTGTFHIPQPVDGTFDVIQSISADGKVAVGSGTIGGQARAVRWTAATGTVPLQLEADGTAPVFAYAASADGSVIVGGSSSGTGRAFIWDSVHGTRDLQHLLTDEYGLGDSFAGWDFNNSRAWGVSADGQTIVGLGRHADGSSEAFIAHLVTVPEPSALFLAGTGFAALAALRLRQYRACRPPPVGVSERGVD